MSTGSVPSYLRHRLPDRNQLAQYWKNGDAMFGKPHWFIKKKIGWGLTPVTWQGWVYTAAWALIIGGPFALLVNSTLVPEAVVWMVASSGTLLWDVRQIMRAKQQKNDKTDVFYIGDDAPDGQVATRNYKMELRK